jgi:hypothetical protein
MQDTQDGRSMKTKLAITVPSRGRPHNLKRLAEALKETCTGDYELLARIDADDPARNAYLKLKDADITVGERIFFTLSLNELAQKALERGFTHLAILGDDVLPETVGWDVKMINALNGKLGVVYGSDGLENLHGPDLPTHVVLPIEMYKRLGWIGLPGSRHLFCDNAWRELGKLTQFIYLKDVKLTHLHRWNKSAPDDQTYKEANNKIKRELDRRAFEAWRDGEGLQKARAALQ